MPVYRKTFNVLVQADSYEDARRRLNEFVGDILGPGGCEVVIEEIYGFEGDEQPVFWKGKYERWPRYPGKATFAALTNSLSEAKTAFAALDGSMTLDDYYDRELNFNAADDSSPKDGTMPAPERPGRGPQETP